MFIQFSTLKQFIYIFSGTALKPVAITLFHLGTAITSSSGWEAVLVVSIFSEIHSMPSKAIDHCQALCIMHYNHEYMIHNMNAIEWSLIR
jgi:hypothetical protein